MGAAFDAIPTSAEVPIPVGTYADVDAMAPHCDRCQRCDLGRTRTRAALYRGNPHARLMLIGEGPGEQEDRQGRPFVGPAGQLLDRILRAVAFDPDRDAFIANVVKCRPPGNRVPEPPEAAACLPYLAEQIRLVDPALFVFVGATALRYCTGDSRGITRVRGQWFTHLGRPAMAVFHPSYMLRNPARTPGSPKWLMWQDIRAIRARYDELVGPRALSRDPAP